MLLVNLSALSALVVKKKEELTTKTLSTIRNTKKILSETQCP